MKNYTFEPFSVYLGEGVHSVLVLVLALVIDLVDMGENSTLGNFSFEGLSVDDFFGVLDHNSSLLIGEYSSQIVELHFVFYGNGEILDSKIGENLKENRTLFNIEYSLIFLQYIFLNSIQELQFTGI